MNINQPLKYDFCTANTPSKRAFFKASSPENTDWVDENSLLRKNPSSDKDIQEITNQSSKVWKTSSLAPVLCSFWALGQVSNFYLCQISKAESDKTVLHKR